MVGSQDHGGVKIDEEKMRISELLRYAIAPIDALATDGRRRRHDALLSLQPRQHQQLVTDARHIAHKTLCTGPHARRTAFWVVVYWRAAGACCRPPTIMAPWRVPYLSARPVPPAGWEAVSSLAMSLRPRRRRSWTCCTVLLILLCHANISDSR